MRTEHAETVNKLKCILLSFYTAFIRLSQTFTFKRVSTQREEANPLFFRCAEGTDLVYGDLTRTCQSDGSWSGQVPLCTGIIRSVFYFRVESVTT